jgi:hypothetical protein
MPVEFTQRQIANLCGNIAIGVGVDYGYHIAHTIDVG